MTGTVLARSPLVGFNVALTDLHQPEIAAVLRSRGAAVTEVPLVQVVPTESDARLRTALRHCIRHPVDYVFVEGAASWQRLCAGARAWHLLQPLLDCLSTATIVVEDPAVAQSLRADGLARIRLSPAGGEVDAAAWLLDRNLANSRVMVVQHDGARSHLVSSLRARRVNTTVVRTVRFGPPSGLAVARRLVGTVIRREIHAALFTTALPLDVLVGAATRMGWRDELLLAFAGDVLAACGEPPHPHSVPQAGIRAIWLAEHRPTDVAERLSAELAGRRCEFDAGGRRFVVQGDAIMTEEVTTLLTPGPAAVLRALASHQGTALSRSTLARLAGLPGRLSAVDMAVVHLRAALGENHRLVSTVPRQGYRLNV